MTNYRKLCISNIISGCIILFTLIEMKLSFVWDNVFPCNYINIWKVLTPIITYLSLFIFLCFDKYKYFRLCIGICQIMICAWANFIYMNIYSGNWCNDFWYSEYYTQIISLWICINIHAIMFWVLLCCIILYWTFCKNTNVESYNQVNNYVDVV